MQFRRIIWSFAVTRPLSNCVAYTKNKNNQFNNNNNNNVHKKAKVKLFLSLIKLQDINMYEAMEVYLHAL
jgi:hypothetical protein